MNGVESRGRVVGLVFGAMAAEVLFTAARLGVADRLGDNERAGSELAAELGADSTSVTRLLRAMAALELLEENDSGRFRLTEAGALLRTDRPDSMTSSRIAARNGLATSSPMPRRAPTCTCSRASSMTGTTAAAAPSSVTYAPSSPRTAGY